MTEQATVQEHVESQHGNTAHLNAGGEDVASSVYRAARSQTLSNQAGESSHDGSRSTALSDAKRYRKRAQAAEKQVEELKATLAEREQKLSDAEKSLTQQQRRQQIDHALINAGALDIEMARQLAEAALAQAPEGDITAAIDELKRAKPFLFRQNSASPGSGAMSAADDSPSPRNAQLHRAASSALETGKRSDLLRYLRLRRRGA
jgi:hypothetical protein